MRQPLVMPRQSQLAACGAASRSLTNMSFLAWSRVVKEWPCPCSPDAIGTDAKLRKQLQAKVIEEEWTVTELFKEIQGERGRQRQPGGGRRIKVPKNIKAAVTHFTAQAEKFIRANDQVWFGEDFDIVDELAEVPADKLSDELKEQVLEVADFWEKIMALGKVNGERLREAIEELDRRREAQAEIERQLAGEEGGQEDAEEGEAEEEDEEALALA